MNTHNVLIKTNTVQKTLTKIHIVKTETKTNTAKTETGIVNYY
jgi:hypothetical protein